VYPIILNLRGRRALVVGGGPVAERKLRGLLDADADVTVVSPTATSGIAEFAQAGRCRWLERRYEATDVEGAFLVFAATDDAAVNAAVGGAAHAVGALVNDAGEAGRGDFATPAVHRSGRLMVSVDSGGLSPSFTKRIRDELAVVFDTRYARAAVTLGRLRERVTAVLPPASRAAVMRHFSERDIDDLAGMPATELEHEVERAADTVANVVPADPRVLVCASRASALAMVQTRLVMAQLAAAGIASTVLNITTRGDAVQDRALAAIGGDSLFVKELETALRDRRADYAVHSCKDLPSTLPDDFTIAAITPREDPRDAFCSARSRRARGSGRRVRGGAPSSTRCGLIWCTTTSAGTSTPACASCATASTPRSSWPVPDCAGSGSPRPTRCHSIRPSSRRRSARGRSRSRRGATIRTRRGSRRRSPTR
jgi:precorrin-2 dehydrogenase/sirohydrochlorin ferrochelatase